MIHIDCVAMYTNEVRSKRGFPYPYCPDCRLSVQHYEIDEFRPDGESNELLPDMGVPDIRRKAINGERWWA